jgi:prevent-host-death family protein
MTIQIGVREFREKLSHYLAVVSGGGEISITSHGKRIAELKPPAVTGGVGTSSVPIGTLKGKIWIADDFDAPDNAFNEAYEGGA